MPAYRFALQNSGTKVEELGVMVLPSDGEAVAFAEQLVRDLACDPEREPGLAVTIIKSERTIRSIPIK